MSVWKINEKAKTNGRNTLMVCHALSLAPIAEIKMPYIPNGTTRATPDIEGQKKLADLVAAAPDLLEAVKCYLEGEITIERSLMMLRRAVELAEGRL